MALSSSADQPQPLGRIVLAVKDWIARLGEVWVEAQVIEIKRRKSPTQFLTLRDRTTDISASVTVTSFVLDSAGHLPEGSQVIARLKPRLWDRNSSLHFECLEIKAAGEGRLLAQLEELKRKLQAEGLFEGYRKRRLPLIPRAIGLITSPGSDAEHDVLTNTAARWPAQFITKPVMVQGPKAVSQVIAALRELDANDAIDVIVIARGGGSLEDLLPFSDEGLIREVAAATTPVISAIGHEQDVPLLDFVADARASTPTGVAAIVVPDHAQETAMIAEAKTRLRHALTTRLSAAQQALTELRSRPVLRNPLSALEPHLGKLELLRHRLLAAMNRALEQDRAQVTSLLSSLRAMSPKATLQRGYAVVVDQHSRSVTSVDDVAPGIQIQAWLVDGLIDASVTATHRKENHG